MALDLRAGIAVLGSLDWESHNYGPEWNCEQSERRVAWRRKHLDEGSMVHARLPIRYGRRSRSRDDTFTMVVSPSYRDRLGTAKLFGCQRRITSAADLVSEAEALWFAEGGRNGRVSGTWGSIALMVAPNFMDHPDGQERSTLLDGWAARVSKIGEVSPSAADFTVEDTATTGGLVLSQGRLNIDWPDLVSGGPAPFDLLLITVTKPTLVSDGYASVEAVAKAWKERGHRYYFDCNRLSGIETADDEAIDRLLAA